MDVTKENCWVIFYGIHFSDTFASARSFVLPDCTPTDYKSDRPLEMTKNNSIHSIPFQDDHHIYNQSISATAALRSKC